MDRTTSDSLISSGSSFLSKNSKMNVVRNKAEKDIGKKTCCPSLTIKQRVIGFAVCTVLGKDF